MSVTAFVAIFSSLLISIVTRRIDRRLIVLSFSLLQVISSLLVEFTPNFFVLMLGRIFLGIAVGGFWALSISIAMRLVMEKFVPKALSIIFSGVYCHFAFRSARKLSGWTYRLAKYFSLGFGHRNDIFRVADGLTSLNTTDRATEIEFIHGFTER